MPTGVLILAAAPIADTGSGGAVTCLLDEPIQLTRIPARIELEDELSKRRKDILVRVLIDCESHMSLRPRSSSEAIKWLDLVLPIEFRSATVQGPYLNPVKYGHYGPSVVGDLAIFYSKEWGLCHIQLCRSLDDNDPENLEATCFTKLLELWREKYVNSR